MAAKIRAITLTKQRLQILEDLTGTVTYENHEVIVRLPIHESAADYIIEKLVGRP